MPVEVIFFNVGQGDCTFLYFYERKAARTVSKVGRAGRPAGTPTTEAFTALVRRAAQEKSFPGADPRLLDSVQHDGLDGRGHRRRDPAPLVVPVPPRRPHLAAHRRGRRGPRPARRHPVRAGGPRTTGFPAGGRPHRGAVGYQQPQGRRADGLTPLPQYNLGERVRSTRGTAPQ